MANLDSVISNGGAESSSKQRKRNRFEIYYDILTALKNEITNYRKQSLTRVAARVNMPYDRLKDVLSYLADIGFCENLGAMVMVTEKGEEFLLEYHKFNESINKMGLDL